MSTVLSPPRHVQAFYSTRTGMLLRVDGQTRTATLDEVEQAYSQAVLDEVMSTPGQWVDVLAPTAAVAETYRCRCWADYHGDNASIILPGFGKIVLNVCHVQSEALAGRPGLRDLFARVLDANNAARRLAWKRDDSDKAYIELTADDVAAIAGPKPMRITRAVRHVDLSKFTPGDKPAA